MKIELETKFDIGQTVYSLKDKTGAVIFEINADITKRADAAKSETDIWYWCNLEDGGSAYVFKESELTAEKPKSIYDLKYGDIYYLLNNLGSVQSSFFYGNSFDKEAIAQGNAFLTVEEAEKEAKRKEIHQELRKVADGYEFAVGKSNYYIQYDASRGTIHKGLTECIYTPGVVYFPTGDAVKDAIREIGEERLIKDYFGMEEENG